jgi:hypothetical protein
MEANPAAVARDRLRTLGWIAAAAAGAVLPLAVVLARGGEIAWRDTLRLHAPLRGLVVDALRDLRLPLWNPHEALGLPLLAQLVHGVLHPFALLAALLAPDAGLAPLVVAATLSAAAGAAVLARQLGCSPAAAGIAGLAFGLCGYVLSMSSVLHYLVAAGTAPWTIAGLRAAADGRRATLLGALGVAASHFAGDPQWTLVAAALGTALALEARGPRGAVPALAAVALGSGIAGIQLLPAWANLEQSARGHLELTPEERRDWALAPWRTLELLAPGLVSGRVGETLDSPVFRRFGASGSGSVTRAFASAMPFVPSVCIGAAPLALAALGAGGVRRARSLAPAALGALWLAYGSVLGAEPLLRDVPVWGSFRYAEKLVGPFSLCVALLAGFGADRARAHLRGRPCVALAGAAAGLAASAGLLHAGAGAALLRTAGAADAAPLLAARLALGLGHAAASLAGLALVLRASRRASAAAPALLALLVLVQGLAASPFSVRAGARGVREPQPLAEIRGAADVVRIATPLRALSTRLDPALDAADALLALESRMGTEPFAAPSGIGQFATYTALIPWQKVLVDNALGWESTPQYWPAQRRFGTTHVVVRNPRDPVETARVEPAIAGGTQRLASPWGFTVWEVPHRPWACFAEAAIGVRTSLEALAELHRSVAVGSARVILEGEPPRGLAAGRVLAIERRPERVRIEAESEGEGLLVVNDAYWPGWRARIDGRPARILRADALVRAVVWPPGRHALEMVYDPPEARQGAWITAASLLACAGLAAASLRRPRAR